jgi:addiction module HigA family antidote
LEDIKLNQEQIAQKLGISQSLLSQILSGNRAISKTVAIRLSEQFGEDPGWWAFASLDQVKEKIENHQAEAA